MRLSPIALVCIAGIAGVAARASAAPTLVSQGNPHPGIHRETWADAAIPARLYLIRIDLTSAEIGVLATKESDRGVTTSTYAAQSGAQVAINGDAFSISGYRPRGLAMGDGDTWSTTSDDDHEAVLHFRRVGERTYASIVPPELIVTPSSLPAGTQGVVSGKPLLVRNGVVDPQTNVNDPVTLATQRTPRSAVGVSADGNSLYLVAVDGWQASSLGMTAAELAQFMQAHGSSWAMALDGGSSSTLVLDDNLLNNPSDGVERTVANHLAIKYGSLPKGQLVGLVCKMDVFGCGNDPARKISGALVRLDDGRTITTDTTAFYDFTGVTQRLACVRVSKAGYLTKVQCAQVHGGSGGPTYNSVALFPGTDPPDAGVPDGGMPVVDASPFGTVDGGGDAGDSFMGPGGGCCDTGSDRTQLIVAVLVAWFLTRRRGTTGS